MSINFLFRFFEAVARWMDGSLFFRGFTGVLNFLKALCGGSFIVGLFTAHDTDSEANPADTLPSRSFLPRVADKILNGIPKPIFLPDKLPKGLSNLLSGSWLVNTAAEYLGTPIPSTPSPAKSGGWGSLVVWGMFAIPVWGLAFIVFATPFLPTMMLAMLLVPILLFTVLSRKFVVDYMAVFLLLFIIINMIAGVLSTVPSSSIQIAVLTSMFVLTVMMVVSCCTSRKNVDFFILILVAAGGLTGVVGVYQVLAGYTSTLWLDLELHADIRFRVFSTFDNANVYGTYLLLVIPITAACVFYLKHWFLKLCAAGATGLLLVNLMLTYSRGAYVSLVLGVGVFILIIEKRLVVLSIPAILALPLMLPATVINRVLSIFNFADTSTIFRLSIYQGAIRIIRDFWFAGVGQGLEAFHRVYPYYAIAAAGTVHAHSLFLQILVEIGIVGFLVFMGIIACFFRAQATFLRNTQDMRLKVMSAAMIAGMVGFLVQGIFDHNFFNYRLMLTFYLFVGICMAFTRVYSRDEKAS